jgi:hypothetical protein
MISRFFQKILRLGNSTFLASNLLSGLLLFGVGASADILLEPYVGYVSGQWEYGTSKVDCDGYNYGGRLGIQQMGLMVGADVMSGKYKDEATPKNDITPTDYGFFLGYNFPMLLRVYGVYNFKSEFKTVDPDDTNKYEGTGMKFGIGLTMFPMVSINLEYFTGTYDEINGSNLTSDFKTKGIGIGVSLPLVL